MNYIQKKLSEILKIVDKLEKKYKDDNRKFTLDGHLFGSIGEIYAKEKYNSTLMPPSQKGFDALDESDNKVQIKVTRKLIENQKLKKLVFLSGLVIDPNNRQYVNFTHLLG